MNLMDSLLGNILQPNEDEAIDFTSPKGMNDYLAKIIENPDMVSIDSEDDAPNTDAYSKERKILLPSEWALNYRLIKGKPMSFYNFPYQKEIFNDMSPRQTIKKSAQMGISELFLTKMFWFGDYHMGKAIYTFPTAKDMFQYAASRIPQIIEGSIDVTPDDPYWDNKYHNNPTTYIESMLYVNNASMRRINDFFIYYKGTFGDSAAISIDSDWNIHDEINFSNQNVVNKFKSRLGASDLKWEYQFSTPTIPGFGVSKTFDQSDQRVWIITCPHCNQKYKMEFERNVVELAFGKGIIYQCHHCHNEISPETRRNGTFIAQSPSNDFWRGYHISKMMNPRLTARELVDSKDGYKKVSDFYNFDLGEDYSENSTALTQQLMEDLQRPYKMWGSARPEHGVVMGFDQGDILWATLSIPDMKGKDKIIYKERIDCKDRPDQDPFNRIRELMHRYNVQVCVGDALPNKNDSRKLVQEFPGRYFMAFYTATKDGDYNVNDDDGIVNIDRTETFKDLFNDVVQGNIITPAGHAITEIFNKHHLALKKETQMDEDTGAIKEFFIRTDHDHFAHSNLYRKVARSIYNEKYAGKSSQSVATENNPHWNNRVRRNNGTNVGGVSKIPTTIPRQLRK